MVNDLGIKVDKRSTTSSSVVSFSININRAERSEFGYVIILGGDSTGTFYYAHYIKLLILNKDSDADFATCSYYQDTNMNDAQAGVVSISDAGFSDLRLNIEIVPGTSNLRFWRTYVYHISNPMI